MTEESREGGVLLTIAAGTVHIQMGEMEAKTFEFIGKKLLNVYSSFISQINCHFSRQPSSTFLIRLLPPACHKQNKFSSVIFLIGVHVLYCLVSATGQQPSLSCLALGS